MADVTETITIARDPNTLYDLVSDVTRMGEWSPETTSCRWIGGSTGATVGARFRGANRDGWRRWSTTCTVTEAERGAGFAFDVRFGPMGIATWRYDFTPNGSGCVVRESWTDRRPAWFRTLYPYVMGVRDRAERNRDGMRATLAALKSAAESR